MFYRPGIDPHGLPYNPFKGLIVPRPIAWVSTVDPDGHANLAPFSFFNAVSEAPPIVMFAPYGLKPKLGEIKDTPRNVLRTGEFVVNLVGWTLRDEMNVTSGPYAANVDEFEKAGLTKAPSELVTPPRVAEAPAALECKFLSRTELPSDDPDYENAAIFGQVIGVYISDDIIKDGKVDVELFQPISRLGYRDYAVVREVFELSRPKR
ncbi:flavin reductase family protein [Tritonibacter mobilis]|uniref:flavin reductase family protein n=1 Tax=Tritonibacter mobilis TaxID=379347 RepID=UPI003A5BEF2E